MTSSEAVPDSIEPHLAETETLVPIIPESSPASELIRPIRHIGNTVVNKLVSVDPRIGTKRVRAVMAGTENTAPSTIPKRLRQAIAASRYLKLRHRKSK